MLIAGCLPKIRAEEIAIAKNLSSIYSEVSCASLLLTSIILLQPEIKQ